VRAPEHRAAALALAIAIGAATSAHADAPKLKLWHSYTGVERAGLEAAVAALKDDRFTVEASFVPFDAMADKLTAAIPRGHGPDVFIFAHNRIGGWAEGGIVEPIELFVDEAMLDRHLTPCVFALAYGDSLYGMPLAFKALALFVRSDLVKTPPTDFDTLIQIAKANTDADAARYGLVYANADFFFHTPLMLSLGGSVYGDDPKSPNVDNPGMTASLAMTHRLAQEGILPSDPTVVMASGMFSEGRTPFVINGPWFRGEIDPGVQYTVVPIPAFPGGEASSGWSTCEGVMMSRHTEHKVEAFELMRFLSTTAEGAVPRMKTGGQTITLIESFEAAVKELPEAERAIYEAFRTAFEQSKPTPIDPSLNAVWTPMNAALYKTIHRGMKPAEATAQAQTRVNKALRKK